MSQTGGRQPPRFVPTLTDVVTDALNNIASDVPANALLSADASAAIKASSLSPQAPEQSNLDDGVEPTGEEWVLAAQSIQARVMQRVDASLEERLRYVLADVVQMHSQSLYQALRQDVEQVVNAAVHEAVAQELEQMQRTRNK